MRFNWLRWLTGRQRNQTRRAAPARGTSRRTSPPLGVEALEDRIALSGSPPTDFYVVAPTVASGGSTNGLFTSNGTTAGTSFLKDLGPNTTVNGLTTVVSRAYFYVGGQTSSSLETSDGTATGTVDLHDFSDTNVSPLTPVGNEVFFTNTTLTSNTPDTSVHASDGTTGGTVAVKDLGSGNLTGLTALGNTAYFTVATFNGTTSTN